MANTSAPNGFQPMGTLSGSAPTGGFTRRLISTSNSTAIYRGDPVTSLNTGYVAQSTAGTTQIAGIFWGCKYYSKAAKQPVWYPFWGGTTSDIPSGGTIEAYVIDNPNELFLVQSGNGGPVTFASVGNNINFALGTGNSTTGISGAYADFATIATTNTLPFRIIELASDVLVPGINGADSTTAFDSIIVALNFADRNSTTGI
jgi:hypothetical protein